jgi:prolyl oligopeptidase
MLATGFLLAPAGSGPADSLHAVFAEYWEHEAERNPTDATYRGDHRWSDRLEDLSAAARERDAAARRSLLERVRRIDRERLSAEDRLSSVIFDRLLSEDLGALEFEPYLTPVSQQGGPHLSFAELPSFHPLDTLEHAEAYVARLRAFPGLVDQMIANLEQGIAKGVVAWRGSIEKSLPQVRELASAGPDGKHPMALAADAMGETIPLAQRERIAAAIEAALEEAVRPAYARLARFLEAEYLPACRTEPGVRALPRGEERYAFEVRRHTTTELSPTEVHDLGLREIARIRGEMETIREAVGFSGSLRDFFAHLRADPALHHTSTDRYLEEYRGILREMNARLPQLFGRLPRAACELKEMESWRAQAAPTAYYYSPPDDGSRPGYFYVNTYDLSSRPRYSMEALAYHEAVPGHHLQLALQQELELPDFRRHRGFTAFVEGWGLYSERLPKEVGLYRDPYSDFGRLVFEAWRAARLVVDTGLHAFGWTRERAIEYLEANTALARHDIESEVDRYIASPGQALAYKIGEIRIRELRREAEEALGDRFDVRRFHDFVLGSGSLPLDVLTEAVHGWIEGERGGGVPPR